MGMCGSRQFPAPPSPPLVFGPGFQVPDTAPYANATHSSSALSLLSHPGDLLPIDYLNLTDRISERGRVVTPGPFCDVSFGVLGPRRTPVAIKIIRELPDQQVMQRLQDKLPEWVRIRHPRVNHVLGYAAIGDTTALITSWCPNGTIMRYIRKNLSVSRIALVRQVAQGLCHLHTRHRPIVHGDITPRAILINSEGRAIISEFSLYKIMSRKPDGGSIIQAETRYCAPELLLGAPRTMASDVYAFASVALEILTGNVPFMNSQNDAAVIFAKASGWSPLPRDYPELPSTHPLWAVLQECWHSDPRRRPNMSHLVAELDDIRYWDRRRNSSRPSNMHGVGDSSENKEYQPLSTEQRV